MTVEDRVRLYACEQCGETYQYAGFCDQCVRRLTLIVAMPIRKIQERLDAWLKEHPESDAAQFVESLLSQPRLH